MAVGRFEAWKASASRIGARQVLEFVRAWYPGLDLSQLATFWQEAHEELVALRPALIFRAGAITDYTDTSIFVPELAEDGVEAPPEWFRLNPEDDEDSAEVIDSNDEGEDEGGDEEGEEGEEDAPEVRADGQPQPDHASNNEPHSSAPTAAGGDQAETD